MLPTFWDSPTCPGLVNTAQCAHTCLHRTINGRHASDVVWTGQCNADGYGDMCTCSKEDCNSYAINTEGVTEYWECSCHSFHLNEPHLTSPTLVSDDLIGPISWGHRGPLCHALSLSSSSSSLSLSLSSWTSMRRRRATVPLATSAQWA